MIQPNKTCPDHNGFQNDAVSALLRGNGTLKRGGVCSFVRGRAETNRLPLFLGILWSMLLPLAALCLVSCAGFGSRPTTLTASDAASLRIVTNHLAVGATQINYGAALVAIGGVPPYSWTQTGGQLPAGLGLNSATGIVAGTPTVAGTFVFTVKVQDSKTSSVSKGLTLGISTAKSIVISPAPAVTITSPSNGAIVSGTVGISAAISQSRTASVQFYLGGTPLGPTQSSTPYTVVWDTTQIADGTQSLSAIATDDTGSTTTQAAIAVTVKNTSWNPAVLGVSWASDFSSIAANEIDVKMDPRLKIKATGDGKTDDTDAIRAAIHLVSASGGGVVYFPVGEYNVVTASNAARGNPLVVPSRVILRGASAATSRILVNDPNSASETDWIGTWGGITFQGSSLSGMTDLGVSAINSSTSPCAVLWNRGSSNVTELFFNNLDVHLDTCRNFWIESANKLLVQNTKFDSTALSDGPIYIVGNSDVSFISNTITYLRGRVHLQDTTNLLMQGNTLTRNAENKDMDEGTAIESGGVEISFGQHVQVVNNTIQTLNAPPNEAGDGEAIMSQQSEVPNVLDAGSATGITATTLTDTSALWGPITVSRITQFPEVVAIVTGSATGEWRTIQSLNSTVKSLTVSQPWSPIPEVGSLYSIFVWTLMQATIQGNTLIDNPNGIVLWDGCYACTVQNNTLTNSRGILLRAVDDSLSQSLYPESRHVHEIAMDTTIAGNLVSNTSGVRPAYIALDVEAFEKDSYRGTGMFGIQVAGNTVTSYAANPSQSYNPQQNEIAQDGLFPCFLFGPATAKDPVTTVFRNINFWNNSRSSTIAYRSNFTPYTTQTCITASPPAPNAP